MVLDSHRHLADRFLDPLARPLERVSPNAISWAAFGCAAAASAALVVGGGPLLGLAAFLVFLNALLDALDGKVAKATGRASLRGDFVDHVLDRYADVFVLGAIALGPYCPPALGLVAIVGVLLTSYMGTQAQAVGLGRDYGGLLGRADRLALLIGAIAIQAIADPAGRVALGVAPVALTVLGWAIAAIGVLSHITAAQRALRAWRRLSAK